MSWPEVAKRVGLSSRQTQRIARRAMAKLRDAAANQGLTEEYLRQLAHDREREESARAEALTAMAAARYLHDD